MEYNLLFSFKLSLFVAGISTILVLITGVGLAYLLVYQRPRGHQLLDIALTLPLVLPPTIIGYYLITLLGRNGVIGQLVLDLTGDSLMFTPQAAICAAYVVSLPLMVKSCKSSFESIDPHLLAASYSLGHNRFSTFWRITLPLARPGILAGVILSFARALGEFGATLMVAGNIPGKTDTVPLAIYSLVESGQFVRANQVVLIYTLIAAIFLLISNILGGRNLRAWKGEQR
ncbi:MAG: molybdate ABC transporter permease subunit [Bdellovibrionales bacterium]|jgi:molybdate transport system permease protein|nr:molybdate ABC transporter permease subunit [Bdellovibrionales bacterium]MBT3525166.1 molybdate ABC transporter permease subunit [Bdellovibrionales bacterium]MBT7669496.1 molybdate ABC transporter permease subunit [Bdellovibrionales bacterium]MBT7766082.1 molybdate ABC transporter permease subunit [Bdellovibrionales bacterium]